MRLLLVLVFRTKAACARCECQDISGSVLGQQQTANVNSSATRQPWHPESCSHDEMRCPSPSDCCWNRIPELLLKMRWLTLSQTVVCYNLQRARYRYRCRQLWSVWSMASPGKGYVHSCPVLCMPGHLGKWRPKSFLWQQLMNFVKILQVGGTFPRPFEWERSWQLTPFH